MHIRTDNTVATTSRQLISTTLCYEIFRDILRLLGTAGEPLPPSHLR